MSETRLELRGECVFTGRGGRGGQGAGGRAAGQSARHPCGMKAGTGRGGEGRGRLLSGRRRRFRAVIRRLGSRSSGEETGSGRGRAAGIQGGESPGAKGGAPPPERAMRGASGSAPEGGLRRGPCPRAALLAASAEAEAAAAARRAAARRPAEVRRRGLRGRAKERSAMEAAEEAQRAGRGRRAASEGAREWRGGGAERKAREPLRGRAALGCAMQAQRSEDECSKDGKTASSGAARVAGGAMMRPDARDVCSAAQGGRDEDALGRLAARENSRTPPPTVIHFLRKAAWKVSLFSTSQKDALKAVVLLLLAAALPVAFSAPSCPTARFPTESSIQCPLSLMLPALGESPSGAESCVCKMRDR